MSFMTVSQESRLFKLLVTNSYYYLVTADRYILSLLRNAVILLVSMLAVNTCVGRRLTPLGSLQESVCCSDMVDIKEYI